MCPTESAVVDAPQPAFGATRPTIARSHGACGRDLRRLLMVARWPDGESGTAQDLGFSLEVREGAGKVASCSNGGSRVQREEGREDARERRIVADCRLFEPGPGALAARASLTRWKLVVLNLRDAGREGGEGKDSTCPPMLGLA
mmetsp:Transcript_79011/g.164117  ORF Transcript_79011/g.164117 Transcript_79011/m.164117 type:complete len:144 (-) Transcript_79011:111-542(-)